MRAAAPRAAASARDARRRWSASRRNAPSATAGRRVRARFTCSANARRPRQRIVADERAVAHGGQHVGQQPVGRDHGLELQRRLRESGAALLVPRERILQRDAQSRITPARVDGAAASAVSSSAIDNAVAIVDERGIAGDAAGPRDVVSVSGRSPKSHASQPRRSSAGPACANDSWAASPSCARSASRSRPRRAPCPRRRRRAR